MPGFFNDIIPSTSQDHVGWEDAPFLARLTSVYTPSSGSQSGLNLYAFIEQSFDPATGIPVDANPGRQTNPQSGAPVSTYAIEENNALLTVPGSTPSPYTNPGPYVLMTLKGYVGGAPVYQFSYLSSNVAWVKATSSTSSTITLTGGTITGYTATVESFNSSTGTWTPGATAWIVGVNDESVTNGDIYLCSLLGTDASGTPIFGMSEPSSSSPSLTTWYSQVNIPAFTLPTAGTSAVSAQYVTLPYTGYYLLVAQLNGDITPTSSVASYFNINAQLWENGVNVTLGNAGQCCGEVFQNSGGFAPYQDSVLGSVTLAELYNCTTANTQIAITASVDVGGSISSATIGGAITAYYLSPGAIPSASTVNGVSGGVTLQGGGSGSGGITPSTSGTTITLNITGPLGGYSY